MTEDKLFPIELDKPVIFAVVGPSGSGKTTAVEFVSSMHHIPVLRSYTTRPMREGEKQGREHIFATDSELPLRNDMIAYTQFGGYHYWATRDQVHGREAILYVIDEIGLSELVGRFEKIFYIVPIYINCNKVFVNDSKRIERDKDRRNFPPSSYKHIIDNNGTLDEFLKTFLGTFTHMIGNPIIEIADWCREKAGIQTLSEQQYNLKKYDSTTKRRNTDSRVRS